MTINENLQNAVKGLKTAKNNIAAALKNKEQEVADNDGFGTFAGKINNLKPSSYQDVSKVTATKDDVLSGKKFVDSNGELTPGAITTQAAKTITPSTNSQTAVAANVYTTGAVTVAAIPSTYVKPSYTKIATTYTPTTTNQTIAAKTYCSGTQTIKGDTNLIAGNIKSGVSIFGVSGNLTPFSGLSVYFTRTAPISTSTLAYFNIPKFAYITHIGIMGEEQGNGYLWQISWPSPEVMSLSNAEGTTTTITDIYTKGSATRHYKFSDGSLGLYGGGTINTDQSQLTKHTISYIKNENLLYFYLPTQSYYSNDYFLTSTNYLLQIAGILE